MANITREGKIQLKPIAWEKWIDKGGQEIGLKFEFVDKDGDTVDGVFGWLKKDGSENENINIFSDALEAGKSVLCEVKASPNPKGGFYYAVKWAASPSTASKSASELRDFLAKRNAETEPESAPQNYPSDEIPF